MNNIAALFALLLLFGCQPERHSPYDGEWVRIPSSIVREMPDTVRFESIGQTCGWVSLENGRMTERGCHWDTVNGGIRFQWLDSVTYCRTSFTHDTLILQSAKYVRQ